MTTVPRNIGLAVVIVVVVAAGALYVSLNQGGRNSTTGTTHNTGPTQCTSPFVRVDANLTLGPGSNNFLGGIAYDPRNGLLYVTTTWASNAVYVVDPSRNLLVDKVKGVGTNPSDVAYDPANGYIYVVNSGSGSVSVINASTDTVIKNITVDANPAKIAYNPANREMYVSITGTVSGYAISGSGVVTINSSSNTVDANISAAPFVWQSAYDGKNGDMYVANVDGNNETVIDTRTNSFVGIVFIRGYHGLGLVTYDASNGNLYFASYGNNTVVVVNGTTNSHIVYGIMNSVISNITIPYASSALGYDPANDSVWVGTNATGGILSVISGTTNKVSNFHLHFIPTAFAYDSANQEMYVVSLPNEILALSYHCG